MLLRIFLTLLHLFLFYPVFIFFSFYISTFSCLNSSVCVCIYIILLSDSISFLSETQHSGVVVCLSSTFARMPSHTKTPGQRPTRGSSANYRHAAWIVVWIPGPWIYLYKRYTMNNKRKKLFFYTHPDSNWNRVCNKSSNKNTDKPPVKLK